MKRVETESFTHNSVSVKRAREYTEESPDEGRTSLAYFDFEKYRSSVILKKDEIWAVRDEYGMPRKYVLIERDGDVNSALFRYLKYNRKVMYQRYKRCGTLHSCGVFVHDLDPEPLDPPSYSHKVVGWGNKKSITKYTIYPRKGEVWAITKYTQCMFGFASPSLLKYQMVEILEDYKLEEGVKAVSLVKVKSPCRSLFQRCQYENANVLYIGSKGSSMDWFSHQVPYFRYSKENSFGGYLELDPSSLPLCIEDSVESCEQDNVINDNILFLALLDKKVRYRKGDGLIWAAYENRSRVPIKYVVGRPKIEANSNKVKLALHELTPCPVYIYEKKLVEAKLPIVCGNFIITSTESETNFMISHRIHFRSKDCTLENDYCYIQPIEGDVWGIYSDMSMLSGRQIYKSRMEYEIVVIVARGDGGTTVAKLVRIEGFRGLFRKRSDHGDQVQFIIPGNECYRFSHRIPSYQFDGRVKQFLKGAFILDPLLVPKNDGDRFSFDDPFILERPNSCPLWSIMLYIVDKQRNGMGIAGHDDNNNITLKTIPNTSVVGNMTDGEKPNVGNKHKDIACKNLNIKLHDFQDVISNSDIKIGEIWATHNEIDGLPNFYVRISNITDARVMVEVTLVEPHPMTEEEMHWVKNNFLACGTFLTSQNTHVKHIGSFSHRVLCDEVKPKDITFWNQDRIFYEISPRKGEVWAIYKNWPHSDMRNDRKYKLVQIVSEFTKEAGLTVAALVRVDGYENIFKRQLHEDFGLYKSFNRKELLRFSHCIPSSQATGFGGCNSNEKPIEVKFSHIGI